MYNFHDEITRAVPIGAENKHFHGGEPIMYAFECALLEQECGRNWVYTAENYVNGNKTVLCRRRNPMNSEEGELFAEMIRTSRVAGASYWQIDRPEGERLTLPRAKEILRHIFTAVLTEYGYSVRAGQIELAEQTRTSTYRS